MFNKHEYEDDTTTYRPTRLYGVILLLIGTFAAVLAGFILLREMEIILIIPMSVILLLVMILVFAKLHVDIRIDRRTVTYRRVFRKAITVATDSISDVDLYTGIIKDGLSQRAASMLKIRTRDGNRHEIDVTPFTLEQRLNLVMTLVSVTSGAKLSHDVLEMMNGENQNVNKKTDRAALLIAIPAIISILVTLLARIYLR